MNYFDSHAHYDDEQFNEDRYDLLDGMQKNSVSYILNAGTDLTTSELSIELANKYSFIYAAVGIHPLDVSKNEQLDKVKDLATKNKVVAIGEIGLDYYYDVSTKELQKEYFANQLALANEVNLPIIVHDREAHKDTMDIIKASNVLKKGVIHCYSGSLEMAKEYLKMDYFLGFNGAITFTNAKTAIEVIKYAPLDRILIETDSPYLTPIPFRGKRNNSMYLKYVVEKIADVKGMSAEEVADITLNNAKGLFGV